MSQPIPSRRTANKNTYLRLQIKVGGLAHCLAFCPWPSVAEIKLRMNSLLKPPSSQERFVLDEKDQSSILALSERPPVESSARRAELNSCRSGYVESVGAVDLQEKLSQASIAIRQGIRPEMTIDGTGCLLYTSDAADE